VARMEPVKPPPVLPCFDAASSAPGLCQAHFRALFGYLYVNCHWYASLPKGEAVAVRFRPEHFNHIFFKAPARGQPRTVWRPERAERILWIGYSVEHPAEIRQVGASRLTFYTRMADRRWPWFLVVTDRNGGALECVTAYPLSHKQVRQSRRAGDTILRR